MTTTTTPTTQFATDEATREEIEQKIEIAQRDLVRYQKRANAALQAKTRKSHEQMIKNIEVFIAEQIALLAQFDAAPVAEVQQATTPAPAPATTIEDVEAAWQAWHSAKAAFKAADATGLEAAHAAVKAAFKVALDTQADFNTTPGIVVRHDDEYTWPTRHRFGIEAWIENRPSGKKAQFWAVVQCGDERSEFGPIDSLDQQSRLQAWINERCHELVLWCAALAEGYELVADGTPADVEAEALAAECQDCGTKAETACNGCDIEVCLSCYDKRGGGCECPSLAAIDPDDDEIGIDIVYTELLPFEPTADEARATLLELEAQAGADSCEIPGCDASVAYVCDQTGTRVCRTCKGAAVSEWTEEKMKAVAWVLESRFGPLAELAAA